MNTDQEVYELFNAMYMLSHRTTNRRFVITQIVKEQNTIYVHSLEYYNQEPKTYTSNFFINEFRGYHFFGATNLYKEPGAIEKLLTDFDNWPSKRWSDTTKTKVLAALTLALSPEGALPSTSVSECDK